MRGRLPARPLDEVADAAITVFSVKGFRPAVISDVAAQLGLSHGAVYTYADSKQALLYLALLRALDPEAVAQLMPPVTAPPPDVIVELVRTWAGKQGDFGQLVSRIQDRDADDAAPLTVREELELIVDALYGFLERNRSIVRLVERCSTELPELAQWFFVVNRRSVLARIGEYLSARIEAGLLRPVPDVPVAARFIVETSAWFAMHRHGDPDSAMLSDEDCRRTVRHLVPSAFLADGPAPQIEP